MKIKNLWMYVAAVAFALSSCNNDDNKAPQTGDEEISFYLKVSREELSRADASSVINGTEVEFEEGALLFVDDSGNIVRYERITDVYGTGTVTPQELEDGKLFGGINPLAKEVHIVGNIDFDGVTSLGNISDLNSSTFIQTLKDQSDADYGVSNATLYGVGKIVPANYVSGVDPAAKANASHEASVLLKPLIARFEIEKVTAKTGSSVNDGFKLEGIYIDDFYYASSPTGIYSQLQDIVYVDGSSYALYTRATGYSNGDWYPILFDDGWDEGTSTALGLGTAGAGTNPAFTIAPQKNAWAYNFYPDASRHPHIILHLTDVEVEDSNNPGTFNPYNNTKTGNPGEAYLTVTDYKQTSTPNGIVNLEGGHVYKITNLAFDENDLREEPEGPGPDGDKLDVWVEVELMKWKVVEVDPVFN